MQKEVSTEKKIEDYLHLYLGCLCEIIWIDEKYRRGNFTERDNEIWFVGGKGEFTPYMLWLCSLGKMRVILSVRPLSDMIKDERKEVDIIRSENPDVIMIPDPVFGMIPEFVPQVFIYLLSKHFDLFGLIESGLAIDKTKL